MVPKRLSIEPEGRDIFVVVDGKKIAKRCEHDKAWIPLEPGYVSQTAPAATQSTLNTTAVMIRTEAATRLALE